jgi:hypothetical protein
MIGWLSRRAESRWPAPSPFAAALRRLSQAISTLSQPTPLAQLAGPSILASLLEGGAFLACGLPLNIAPLGNVQSPRISRR